MDNESMWTEKRTRQHALYPRQREALGLYAEDLTYKEIAERMQVKIGTARSYVGGAVLVLGASSPTDAVDKALARGELDEVDTVAAVPVSEGIE